MMFQKGIFKGLLLVVVMFLLPSTLPAQQLSDTIADMYKRYLTLMESTQKLQKNNVQISDSLNSLKKSISNMTTTFGTVDQKLTRITNDLSSSLQQVNRITTNDLLTKEARINTKKEKILATATFINSANNSFDAIDAALAQSDYLGDVGGLSSPTNTDLGFSLSDEIVRILNSNIVQSKTKIGGVNTEKVLSFVKQAIQNPMVTSFTSSVPALSSIQAVLGLVSNIAVVDKTVSVDQYMNFSKEIEKYAVHYEALGKANSDFNSNIGKLRTQAEALRVIVRNFTVERIQTTTPDAKLEADLELHQIISQYYDRRDLEKKLVEIVESHRTSNGALDLQKALDEKRLEYPFYAINQAQFIQQELETITGQYIATYRKYHESITKVLNNSKSISKDPNKIDVKLTSLDKKLDNSIKAFERNVKIKEVSRNLQLIPNF
jgi:hypothetical protein